MRNAILNVVGICLAAVLFTLAGCGGGGGGDGGGGGGGAALIVTSTVPIADDDAVETSTTVRATFNAELDPATVSNSTFTLRHGTTSVPGNVSYDGARTLTFSPSTPLSNGTQYTATLTTGIKDLAGHTLPGPRTWHFTTAVTGSGGGGGGF